MAYRRRRGFRGRRRMVRRGRRRGRARVGVRARRIGFRM